jgi:hypothetical protein
LSQAKKRFFEILAAAHIPVESLKLNLPPNVGIAEENCSRTDNEQQRAQFERQPLSPEHRMMVNANCAGLLQKTADVDAH